MAVFEPVRLIGEHTATVRSLFDRSGAGRWSITEQEFASVLARSCTRRFPAEVSPREVRSYLESLHVDDVALAAGCAKGDEAAWEEFVRRCRSDLYAAGISIAGESRGRELADSLYADLFGVGEGAGRRSLFVHYHGRAKLSTWLRSVLARRHVDAWRAARRLESIDGDADNALSSASIPAPDVDPHRHRDLALLQWALRRALQALPDRDRLRLASYYLQQLTLAQIGRLLGEHEATVSRKLERTRRAVHHEVDRLLREEKGLPAAEVERCFAYALEDWGFDLKDYL